MIPSISSSLMHVGRAAQPQIARSANGNFSSILSEMISGAVDTMNTAEKSAISGMNGQIPVTDVVYNILAAERTLQTAISIRDKVVTAFQEISRLQI